MLSDSLLAEIIKRMILYTMSKNTVNFILDSMTFLRYFIPISEELRKNNIESIYYYGKSTTKYDKALNNLKCLEKISKKFDFVIQPIESISAAPITFLIEGVMIDAVQYSTKKISLTYQTDFRKLYPSYIEKCDNVVFPSLYFANYYKTLSKKNMYLGSPKYDCIYAPEQVKDKYGLYEKTALIVFPRYRDMKKVDIANIYHDLKNLGYFIVVKGRGKEPVPRTMRGDLYIEDGNWYPHPTMELISICDFIINFDSTCIKECVMMDKPVINYHIKPHEVVPLDFLYNYDYCEQMYNKRDKTLAGAIEHLSKQDLANSFALSRDLHLFTKGQVSKRIVESIL